MEQNHDGNGHLSHETWEKATFFKTFSMKEAAIQFAKLVTALCSKDCQKFEFDALQYFLGTYLDSQ